jgi:tetratricopeptide (TPR) repeat protein
VPRTVVTPDEVISVPELFERAQRALERGDAEAAARDFDRVFALEPEGPWATRALLAGSEAQEARGSREDALARLERLSERFPEDRLAREARVRAVRLAAYLERFSRAGQIAEALLKETQPLRPIEAIVAHGGIALDKVERGDLDRAGFHVEKARALIEDNQLDIAGRIPRDLAQLYFALGEIRRLRAARITFQPLPPKFVELLEQRCRYVLDAQSAYSDAMRAYDAHWSAMAGYRVGELYQSLHEDLMAIPPPASADSEAKRQLFEGAMRLRFSILQEKALTMMDHTIRMAERTGEKSEWVARAREAKRRLEAGLVREKEALSRLPYTRDELQQALDTLGERVRAEKKMSDAAEPTPAKPERASPGRGPRGAPSRPSP